MLSAAQTAHARLHNGNPDSERWGLSRRRGKNFLAVSIRTDHFSTIYFFCLETRSKRMNSEHEALLAGFHVRPIDNCARV